jgi:WD40 repeat protein
VRSDLGRIRKRYCIFAIGVILCSLAASGAASPLTAVLGGSIWRPRSDWDYDGRRILGHIDNDVCLWDAETGHLLRRFVGHRERIDSVRFSPNGKYALSSSWINGGPVCSLHLPQFHSKDTSVRLWDLRSGRELWRLEGQIAGSLSPDGNRLLTFSLLNATDPDCGGADSVIIWDLASGRRLFSINNFGKLAGTWTFSPDGRSLLGLDGRNAILYDARNGSEINRMRGVESFTFSNRDTSLAISTAQSFDILDSITGELKHQVPVVNGIHWTAGASWSQDASRVVAVVAGRSSARSESKCDINVWTVGTGQIARQLVCDPANYFRSVLLSPDSQRLLISWGGGSVEHNRSITSEFDLFDLDSGKNLTQTRNSGVVLGFSPDGKTFLVGGQAFIVYSSTGGKPLFTNDLLGSHAQKSFGP